MPAKAGIHAFLSKMRKESASFFSKKEALASAKTVQPTGFHPAQ
jgi:hypothetical protein